MTHGAHVGLGEVPMVPWVSGSEATGSGLQEAAVQQGGTGPRAPAGTGPRAPAGGGPVSHTEVGARDPTVGEEGVGEGCSADVLNCSLPQALHPKLEGAGDDHPSPWGYALFPAHRLMYKFPKKPDRGWGAGP